MLELILDSGMEMLYRKETEYSAIDLKTLNLIVWNSMEKNKGNKKQKKSDHTVETPPPPQVMDPSAPLQGVQEEKSNDTFPERKTSDEAKTEKLAPREEL